MLSFLATITLAYSRVTLLVILCVSILCIQEILGIVVPILIPVLKILWKTLYFFNSEKIAALSRFNSETLFVHEYLDVRMCWAPLPRSACLHIMEKEVLWSESTGGHARCGEGGHKHLIS
jgi:hypothetical protein